MESCLCLPNKCKSFHSADNLLPFPPLRMLDLDWSPDMAATNISIRSPRLPEKSPLSSPRVRDATATAAYERYLRLPELWKLWSSTEFPQWRGESILKPSLQALEITFRLVALALADPRPHANRRQWIRRLESLAARQIELIADLADEGAPVSARSSGDASALARLVPDAAAGKILRQIEAQMEACPFTLGLGEPNLAGKPYIEYDLVVKPTELHAARGGESWKGENQLLVAVQQVFESWICAARELLERIGDQVDRREWDKGSSDCWILERIWKLLAEVEDLVLVMDPDDFLRLRGKMGIRGSTAAYCFMSAGLAEVTMASRDLKRRVPWILGVEVDPNGGPRVERAAMGLFHGRRKTEAARIHVLQAFQAVEAAVKKFYFAYRQLVATTVGSFEASGDSLSQMFMEPPYFPSLDAAKTFLGERWMQRP